MSQAFHAEYKEKSSQSRQSHSPSLPLPAHNVLLLENEMGSSTIEYEGKATSFLTPLKVSSQVCIDNMVHFNTGFSSISNSILIMVFEITCSARW